MPVPGVDSPAGRRTLGVHQGPVYSVAFSPDGDRLASGSLDHTVRLWDMKEQRLITTLKGHVSRVFSVSFSPDGKKLRLGSLDGTVKVWDATESEGSEVFDRHLGSYASVAFSHDGRLLARSELGGGKTTVWDAHTWTRLADIPQRLSGFSPDGKLLATTLDRRR